MKKKKNRVTYIIIGLIYVIDLVKSFYPFLPCTFYIVVPVSNISNRSIYAPQKENTSRKQVLFLSFFFPPGKRKFRDNRLLVYLFKTSLVEENSTESEGLFISCNRQPR